MKDFATYQRHIAEEITLLCPNHHRQLGYTLSEETVERCNRNPASFRTSAKTKLFHFDIDTPLEIRLSGGHCTHSFATEGSRMAALVISDTPILEFSRQQDQILLTANFFSTCGKLGLCIKDNEVTHNPLAWDISFFGKRLEMREARGKKTLVVEFHPPNRIDLLCLRMKHKGWGIEIGKEYLYIKNTNSLHSSITAHNPMAAIVIGNCPSYPRGRGIVSTGFVLSYDENNAEKELRRIRKSKKAQKRM